MVRHAVRALLADARVTQVRVIVDPADPWADAALSNLPRTQVRRVGGATRADTVAQALSELTDPAPDWVLVHDAARPGLPASALAALIETCCTQQRGGLLALPVPDTVKRSHVSTSGVTHVTETVSREGLWLAQTPQMYRCQALQEALAQARHSGLTVTDESQAMERVGPPPLLVQGAARNLKVTWPDDFDLMEKWL